MLDIRALLLTPEVFFSDLFSEEQSLKIPALIILVQGILAAAVVAVTTGPMMEMMSETASMGSVITAFVAVVTVIFIFIIWVVIAGIFHLISVYFKGTGEFSRSLQVVSYGTVPQIAGGLITAVITWQYIAVVTFPTGVDPMQVEAVTKEIMSAAPLQAAALISLLFFLWSANIWVYGMREARNLSFRDAAVTVGAPVLLYVIYTVLTTWVM